MNSISALGRPFKIADSVIAGIAIDVITDFAWIGGSDKFSEDDSVNLNIPLSAINGEANVPVSIVGTV